MIVFNCFMRSMSKQKIISVGIVEDQQEILDSYLKLLPATGDFICYGYTDSASALENIPSDKPDVVLMDVNIPGISGIECTRRLKKIMPELQIMMFTVYENSENVFKALEAGASGYVLKQSTAAQLTQAIHDLHAGGAPMSSQIARLVVASFNRNKPADRQSLLTTREEEILGLLSEGKQYKEIADKLFVSISTVRTHIMHIYEKLHVNNRTEAINKMKG